MKYLILLVLLAGAMTVQAQQKPLLKDLLYSGKLKKDSSGVIRSTDDLSTKIDTTTKKEAPPVPAATAAPKADASNKVAPSQPAVPAVEAGEKDSMVNISTSTEASVPVSATPAANAAPAKTNTKLWKEYLDSMTKTLSAEVLKSKQVKKETYYVSLDYEIGLDGLVTVNTVSTTPENKYLQAQIKQILDTEPPRLNPFLDSSGQPEKARRKQNFTVVKE